MGEACEVPPPRIIRNGRGAYGCTEERAEMQVVSCAEGQCLAEGGRQSANREKAGRLLWWNENEKQECELVTAVHDGGWVGMKQQGMKNDDGFVCASNATVQDARHVPACAAWGKAIACVPYRGHPIRTRLSGHELDGSSSSLGCR